MTIKRYTAAGSDVVRTDPNGPLVLFDDYAALHYERIHDLNQIGGLQEENTRLKAEVERLRKAGDAMERSLAFEYPDSPKVKDWNAAKEGKPSV